MAYRHTTVFDAWRSLHTLLGTGTYPAHPVTGDTPAVLLEDRPDQYREVIVVETAVEPTDEEFRTMGGVGKAETYTIRVGVRTVVPGVEADDVIDRLEALVNAAGDTLRDLTTGRPTAVDFAVDGLGHWQVLGVEPQVFRTDDEATVAGVAVIRVGVVARI